MPGKNLLKYYSEKYDIKFVNYINDTEMERLKNYDIVYITSFYAYHILLKDYAQFCRVEYSKIKVIFETDDLVHELSDQHFLKNYYNKNLPSIQNIWNAFKYCDMLVVSTKSLKNYYINEFEKRNIKCPIEICENSLDLEDWNLHLKDPKYRIEWQGKKDKRPIRIGWQGSRSHFEDLELLNDLLKKIKNNQKFIFVCFSHPEIIADNKFLQNFNNLEYHAWVPVEYYAQVYSRLNLDFALAPIRNNNFNRCKSNIKVLEAIICKYIPLASNVGPYKELLSEEFNELLIKKDEWYDRIQKLLETDLSLLKQRLLDMVLGNWTIETKIKKWDEMFTKVMEL
jgi:glycosyltransferase involved in cell wall biosynthesis